MVSDVIWAEATAARARILQEDKVIREKIRMLAIGTAYTSDLMAILRRLPMEADQ